MVILLKIDYARSLANTGAVFSSMKSRPLARLDEEIPSLIKRGADIYKDQIALAKKYR
jgi:hypothetical protein